MWAGLVVVFLAVGLGAGHDAQRFPPGVPPKMDFNPDFDQGIIIEPFSGSYCTALFSP